MKATTIILAITVGPDGADNQHIGDRIAALLDRGWGEYHLPDRLAQDIRVHRHDEKAIGDILNKAVLGESE